jgi:valyl-tRNA synthetase
MVKPVLHDGGDPAAQQATLANLLAVLETLLRTLHPLMPFITEEIWLRVAPLAGVPGDTIMLAPWPRSQDFAADAQAEDEMQWVKQVVLGIRQIRGELDLSPTRRLPVLLQHPSARDLARIEAHRTLLSSMAGLDTLRVLAAGEAAPPASAAFVGDMEILVPLAGLIDPASELHRLAKRLQKTEEEIGRCHAKLGKDSFVRNAPPDVVVQERQRLEDFDRTRAGLTRQIEQVRKL